MPASSAAAHRDALGDAVPSTAWPGSGQAAFVLAEQSQIHAGPNQHPAAIASVAKMMTAYLVLRDHPLRLGQDGPTITLTDPDVADTDRRRRQDESVVAIAAGEQLTDWRHCRRCCCRRRTTSRGSGALGRRLFAAVRRPDERHRMVAGHDSHPLHRPSGYDGAADQARVVVRAMRLPVFASIVATPSATLPVAGTVHSTNRLLGHNGFVGVKTGSDDAASDHGVVLGQPGHDRIAAGLAAADALVDRIAGYRAVPDLQQRTLSRSLSQSAKRRELDTGGGR